VLIKKAAVDPAFKKMLLEKRAAAAEAIALKLEAAEAAMLNAVPDAQLEAIVANTKVSPGLRPAFLGYAGGVMLAALSTATLGCNGDGDPGPDRDDQAQSEESLLDDFASVVPAIASAGGARPDLPDLPEPLEPEDGEQTALQEKKPDKPDDHVTRGIKPDRP
jgi:hypothetical protein